MKKRLFLLLSILVLTGAGCVSKTIQATKTQEPVPVVLTTTTSPTATSSVTAFATSSIDLNNLATWPRFNFKELGFSIKLPFERKNTHYRYLECKSGQPYDSSGQSVSDTTCDGKSTYFYWYFGYSRKSDLDSIDFDIGSISKSFSASTEWSPHFIYNFHQVGNNYSYGDPGTKALILHPVKTFNLQGREVIIFDQVKDVWELLGDKNPLIKGEVVYGVLVKLPGNNKFKAAEFGYYKMGDKNLALQEVETIVKSIQFN